MAILIIILLRSVCITTLTNLYNSFTFGSNISAVREGHRFSGEGRWPSFLPHLLHNPAISSTSR